MRHQTHATATLVVALTASIAGAPDLPQKEQTQDQSVEARLQFDVASVKPNALGSGSLLWSFLNGGFTARYVTIKSLIRAASVHPPPSPAPSLLLPLRCSSRSRCA
jgi:hypothetical protein